nr:MAG TPA: hypothetical protein [Caudoviricetes sp.]
MRGEKCQPLLQISRKLIFRFATYVIFKNNS